MITSLFRKFGYWWSDNGVKIVATIVILALAFADFIAMKNLFEDLHLSDVLMLGNRKIRLLSEVNVYSFTFAILLEGTPYFLGVSASKYADKTKYKVNDEVNARVGLIISLSLLILTILLVFALRSFLIIQNGGWEAFFKTKSYGGETGNNENFIAQVYLLVAPMLTSMLAFIASWTAFRSESITKLEYRVEKKHGKFLAAQSKFLEMVHKNDDARVALWGSLTVEHRMPLDLETFRKECFDRIRVKLKTNCTIEFPDQIERYNAVISGLLQGFIAEMSQHASTLPRDIAQLSAKKFLDEYDNACVSSGKQSEAWSYSLCKEALEEELKTILDNAVVVAQFKTAVKPYHKEGDF